MSLPTLWFLKKLPLYMCTHTLSHACARAQTHTVSLLRGGSMRVLQCACRGQMTTCRSQFSLCSTWGLRDQVEVIRLVSKSHWPFLAFLNTALDTQKFYILMRFNLPFFVAFVLFPMLLKHCGGIHFELKVTHFPFLFLRDTVVMCLTPLLLCVL